jgi:hypothetical protein
MGDYDQAAEAGPPRRRWWPLVAVLAALAVGVGLGYVWRGAIGPEPVASPPPAPVTAPPPMPPAPDTSPCAAVAQRGTDVLGQFRAAAAIGALDPTALRQVLDEIRRLRDELLREVDSCRGQFRGAPDPGVPAPGPGG